MVDPIPPPSNTNLSTANFHKTFVLSNIFNLLLNMTTSMQNIAAAQADRLQLYTSWQQTFTDKMAQIKTFMVGGGQFISGTDEPASQARQSLNQLNSNYIQTLQNRQSVVSDQAKALQSNVNQSNDAVSQQSNLGTAIIQEMNTLLGSIFR